jgi:hypothetical protein
VNDRTAKEEDAMLKRNRRIITAAVFIATATTPAVANARFDLNPPRSPASGAPTTAASLSSGPTTAAPSPGGFDWGDAGIGAAGVLALLGTGSTAVLVRRRRASHQPAR